LLREASRVDNQGDEHVFVELRRVEEEIKMAQDRMHQI